VANPLPLVFSLLIEKGILFFAIASKYNYDNSLIRLIYAISVGFFVALFYMPLIFNFGCF